MAYDKKKKHVMCQTSNFYWTNPLLYRPWARNSTAQERKTKVTKMKTIIFYTVVRKYNSFFPNKNQIPSSQFLQSSPVYRKTTTTSSVRPLPRRTPLSREPMKRILIYLSAACRPPPSLASLSSSIGVATLAVQETLEDLTLYTHNQYITMNCKCSRSDSRCVAGIWRCRCVPLVRV